MSEVAGRVPATVEFLPASRPNTAADLGVRDNASGAYVPPAPDYSEPVVLLGRLKPGTAGESRRVVHVFPLLPEAQARAVLTPLCGERLPVGDMQWLPGMTGMPCEPCLMRNDGGAARAAQSPCGFGLPPARRDPTVSAYQRRLLGGTTPPPGPDLTW